MTASPLDHLVFAVPDLLEGVRRVRELTGVDPIPGGRHERQATANYLLGLGEHRYLEILGPDPDSEQPPHWFDLEHLDAPRLLTWAVRASDLDACVSSARVAGYDPGEPRAMSRRTDTGELLSWRLTPDTVADSGGIVPFLIDWGQSPHPAGNSLPELALIAFTVFSPNPRDTRAKLATLGASADVEHAPDPGLRAVLAGPAGPITLD